MATTVFTRCRRTAPAEPAGREVAVEAPPAVARPAGGAAARLVPVVLAVASLGAVALLFTPGTARHSPMLLLFPLMMIASAVAALASGGAGRQRAELDADRQRYLEYLSSVSATLTEEAAAVRNRLFSDHPDPAALWTVVGGTGMWARHRDEADFCAVRVGIGTVTAPVRPECPAVPRTGEQDPVTVAALQRFLRAHDRLPDAPVTVALAARTTLTVSGPSDQARGVARALICQLAVAHSPDEVGVVAELDDAHRLDWDWLKWLPHQLHYPEARERRLVVVVEGGRMPVSDAATAVVRIVCTDTELSIAAGAAETIPARPDRMTSIAALAVARRLAGYRAAPDPAGGPAGWLDRIGIVDPAQIDPQALWRNGSGAPLAVPIGSATGGSPVDLDIGEAAAGGMGPHGLCLGATGSGKSELLRTIALGMIARHSPATLNLVLVDFKGGATFLDLARAPHTVAVITNLEDEAYLVDRMREALGGEIDRRQRILRTAGARDARGQPAGLPTLLIVVDEFSELLSRHPEFVDDFVAIGRLGRSLGMHLLLASQRLDEGRLRGLDSHLSYRICLKTLSEAESRLAIGVPDAYHLPRRPGLAFLKVGAAQPVRFEAAYVSGPLPGPRTGSAVVEGVPRVFSAAAARGRSPERDAEPGPTVVDGVIDAVAGGGPVPHQLWLPPLTDSPGLDALLADHDDSDLRVPIGLVDRAFEHRRGPLVVDLSGSTGNVAVVGAPRTGKTTVLKTLVSALAATHDPRRVQVYCLDFGGGGLADLSALPQVGTVADRSQPDLVRRTVVELLGMLRHREAAGDVFLVVDGWAAARLEHEGLEEAVTTIAGSGLAHGMHVVIAATRWADVRPALRDLIGTRIELRLGDPADSEIDRARARRIPKGRPGFGLSPDGLPMVIARPAGGFRSCDDGWRAPPIRLLPERVDYCEPPTGGCALGIDEERLEPVTFDLESGHLLVFGEPGCGKTAVLRLLCHEIGRTAPDARLVPIDPRGTLSEFGGDGLRPLPALLEALRDEVGREPFARRTYVVVDDYDLAASALTPLADLLPRARDIGLHLLVARRSGGAARALYDPVLSGLRETGAAGLQMSGNPDDGPLVGGVRPKALPPGRGVLVTRADGERTVQVAWKAAR